ncbi:MAG: hypothetical protein WA817_20540 [Candidatus Acidiferrum sp.]
MPEALAPVITDLFREVAHVIPGRWPLDLHDIGTLLREQVSQRRARQNQPQLNDLHAIEKPHRSDTGQDGLMPGRATAVRTERQTTGPDISGFHDVIVHAE